MKRPLVLFFFFVLWSLSAHAKEMAYEGKGKVTLDGDPFIEKKHHVVPMLWGKHFDLTELTDLQHDLEQIQWRYETHHLIGASMLNLSLLYALVTVLKSTEYKAFLVPAAIAGAGAGFMYWSEQTLKEYTEEYNMIHDKNSRQEYSSVQFNFGWNF